MPKWVPLHVHSQYSILDATASIDLIVKKAKEDGMPALALTDHGNMFGAVEFFKACRASDIRPILGCEVYVAPRSMLEKKKERGERPAYHLTLLAKNQKGYKNLCKLSSFGYLEGFYYHPRVDHDRIKQYREGLICLSGCMSGRLAKEVLEGDEKSLNLLVDWYLDVFKEDFYLELQRHHMQDEDLQKEGIQQEAWCYQKYKEFTNKQNQINQRLIELSIKRGIPLVATNDSHYIERSDWLAHEILLNVQSGQPCETWERDSEGNPKFRTPNPQRRVYPSHEFYFKTQQQMAELFHDLPKALENTLKIAKDCHVELDFKTKHYPVYIPETIKGKNIDDKERNKAAKDYLWQLCKEGIARRYTEERLAKVKEVYPDQDPMQVVLERLDQEMSVIVPKGMCDYFLIVFDFINWAKSQNIPVGPGRGSGVGSIVLYLIGVTDIEPLRFNLFFERFINPERLSYPDIDVDICMERRQEVIQYMLEKYGRDNVAQIITFGTMKAKLVIRDVGRVLSIPLSKVNAITKLIPDDIGMTLDAALEKDPDLRKMVDGDADTKRLFDLGRRLEGAIRNTGIHAAGIIVSGQPLTNVIPVAVSKDSPIPVTQYSMKPVEQLGMLKIDFLGLKTLTAIQKCLEACKKEGGSNIELSHLPLDDQKTFELLNQGKTLGIFQLESGGMQDLARTLHLDKFEEIIAVNSLYRPGPMDMIPSFVSRKHGREPIEYDHPSMKEILSETYGIMVYQEQVMQIARQLANFSLGEGDVLRRAMGKKEMKQMAKQREKFRLGALENQISEDVSMKIFDKMEKFAAYGFNKSHAAAYSFIAYVTAYLKANYPKQWMAALMTCDSHDLTKIAKFIREGQAMKIPILPPDINEAGVNFVATSQGIRFAMSGIKGVGTAPVEAIVTEREKNGPFENLYDFIKRIDHAKVGKKVTEYLIDAGAFDFTGWQRDALKLSVEPMYLSAMKEKKEEMAGVMTFFSLMGEEPKDRFAKEPIVKIQSAIEARLLREKELLGFFLTGHPMDAYKDILSKLSSLPLRKVESLDHNTVFRSGIIVESVAVRFSLKTKRKFAILSVSDGMVGYELPIWPDLFEEKMPLFRENQLLYAVLQVDKAEGYPKLVCKWADDLTKANEEMIRECDRAYDRAKFQMRPGFSKEKKGVKQQMESKAYAKEESRLKVSVDANQMRLSHVLKLKNLFEKHKGKSRVQIDFVANGVCIAKLHIDQLKGVRLTAQLEEEMSTCGAVLSTEKVD